MAMRRKPCHWSPFDKAWLQSRVLKHRANAARRIGRGPWTPWNLFLLLVPGAVVPLSDEAAPILNGQLNPMVAQAECGFLIAGRGCREQIEPFEVARWKRDRFPFGDGRQRESVLRRSQGEADPTVVDFSGKKLGGKRSALVIKTTRCSCRLAAVLGCHLTIEWQRDRLSLGDRQCR